MADENNLYDYMMSPYLHTKVAFPVTLEYIDSNWPIKHVLHWHPEIEFVYQLEGYGFFQVGSRMVELGAGQAILVNSEEYHCTFHPGFNSDGRVYRIGFRPEILCGSKKDISQEKYIDPLLQKQFRLPLLITGSCVWEKSILSDLAEIINYILNRPYGYEYAVKISIGHIISQIIISNKMERTNESDLLKNETRESKIKKALNYIHANYTHKISIKDIAALSKMNVTYFSRFFKIMTGQTPVEYINQLRINQACMLLVDKSRTILDIAMDVGFEDASYFIKTFKRIKKCTPNEFRFPSNKTDLKSLPAGWCVKNIGLTPKPGSACYKDGTFIIAGAGWDIGGNNDEFQFVFVKITGNCSVCARVVSMDNTSSWAKAGVMMRETLETHSRFVHTVITPENGIACELRSQTGDKYLIHMNEKNTGVPAYVKLVREGNDFSFFCSSSGDIWQKMGSTVTIPMEADIYVGLAVTSHVDYITENNTCTAVFDSIGIHSSNMEIEV